MLMDPNLETQEGNPYPTQQQTGIKTDDLLPPDPLLQSDTYIVEVDIDAAPLRTRVPPPESELGKMADTVKDQATESSQKRAKRKQLSEESIERPSWLPENWKMDVRVRHSGATAGSMDRYYIEPVTGKRFRSSKEVLHYLETGSTPQESPVVSQKQQKKSSSSKETKPIPFYFDFENPPLNVSWVQTNASEDTWTPHSLHGVVPECIQKEWSTVFSSVTQEIGRKCAPP